MVVLIALIIAALFLGIHLAKPDPIPYYIGYAALVIGLVVFAVTTFVGQ